VYCHAEGDLDIYILHNVQSHSREKHTEFIYIFFLTWVYLIVVDIEALRLNLEKQYIKFNYFVKLLKVG
jgi:hypothetical protein